MDLDNIPTPLTDLIDSQDVPKKNGEYDWAGVCKEWSEHSKQLEKEKHLMENQYREWYNECQTARAQRDDLKKDIDKVKKAWQDGGGFQLVTICEEICEKYKH